MKNIHQIKRKRSTWEWMVVNDVRNVFECVISNCYSNSCDSFVELENKKDRFVLNRKREEGWLNREKEKS